MVLCRSSMLRFMLVKRPPEKNRSWGLFPAGQLERRISQKQGVSGETFVRVISDPHGQGPPSNSPETCFQTRTLAKHHPQNKEREFAGTVSRVLLLCSWLAAGCVDSILLSAACWECLCCVNLLLTKHLFYSKHVCSSIPGLCK